MTYVLSGFSSSFEGHLEGEPITPPGEGGTAVSAPISIALKGAGQEDKREPMHVCVCCFVVLEDAVDGGPWMYEAPFRMNGIYPMTGRQPRHRTGTAPTPCWFVSVVAHCTHIDLL